MLILSRLQRRPTDYGLRVQPRRVRRPLRPRPAAPQRQVRRDRQRRGLQGLQDGRTGHRPAPWFGPHRVRKA